MKYLKKLAAALLAAVMAMSLLTACGGGGGSSNNDGKNDALAKALGTKWSMEVQQSDALNNFLTQAVKAANAEAEKEKDPGKKAEAFNNSMKVARSVLQQGLEKDERYKDQCDMLDSFYDVSITTVDGKVKDIDENLEFFDPDAEGEEVNMNNYKAALMGISTEKATYKDEDDGTQKAHYLVILIVLKK